jgi:cyanophycinase-like exopeptidase
MVVVGAVYSDVYALGGLNFLLVDDSDDAVKRRRRLLRFVFVAVSPRVVFVEGVGVEEELNGFSDVFAEAKVGAGGVKWEWGGKSFI